MEKKNYLIEIILGASYLLHILVGDVDLYPAIGLLLIYACLKLIYGIYAKPFIRRRILYLIFTFLILTTGYTDLPILVFIPINLYALSKYQKWTLIMIFLPLILGIHVELYLFLGSLSCLAIYFNDQGHDRIKKLEGIIEAQKLALTHLEKQSKTLDVKDEILTYTTRLEERQDIAQQLHDELGHTLSGSSMQLEAACLVLDHDLNRGKDMIHKVTENLRRGSDAIRKILKAIKPDVASISIEEIRQLVLETELQSGIDINVYYDHFISDLTYVQWQTIALNIKEALTNMMKYAKASKCEIKFERLASQFKVSIVDDGIGSGKIKKNMGLQGMTARTHSIDGRLIIDGQNGFSVIMLLPIRKDTNG